MNQEELIRREIKRQLEENVPEKPNALQDNLLSIGGGLTGAGAGFLAMNPVDAFIEDRKIKRLVKETQQREVLDYLDKINRGVLTWDDFPDPATREALQDAYQINKELLDNPEALRQVLGDARKGNVYKFEDFVDGLPDASDARSHLRDAKRTRYLPNLDAIRNPAKLAHPAISAGSLVGMAGGYFLSKELQKKRLSKEDESLLE